MYAVVAGLFQYPIKGFSPQPVDRAELAVGQAFPGDRLYAVEDGPCGFDPAAPSFIPKSRFTVLARIAEVAKARTHYDLKTGILTASAPRLPDFQADLTGEAGRTAFAAWVAALLGDAAVGPLRTLDGTGHRFLDHPLGHVSIINLASVADLEQRLGRPVDPLRFRGNLHVEGWPAWIENGWRGRELRVGGATASVYQTITRCAAPGVDPTTAVRDIDVTAELYRLYGHLLCGIYVQVTRAGGVATGDAIDLAS